MSGEGSGPSEDGARLRRRDRPCPVLLRDPNGGHRRHNEGAGHLHVYAAEEQARLRGLRRHGRDGLGTDYSSGCSG